MPEQPRTWVITTTLNNLQIKGAFIPILRAFPDLRIVMVTDRIGVRIDRVEYVVPARWSVRLFGRLLPRLFCLIRAASRTSVERLMAYNAVPHLLLAVIAGRMCRKPVDLQMIAGIIDLDFSWRPTLTDNRVIRRLKNPRRLERFFRWLAFRHCDRFFTTGMAARAWLIERGIPPSRIFITPGCVDTDLFYPGAEDRGIDVLVVAAILDRKLPYLTMRIFEGVHAIRPETRFCWIGKGFLKDRIYAEIAKSPLQDLVQFVEHTENVPEYYRRAKVFLLNSAQEGLPQATMEAMASHCVPVTSNVGDVSDIVINGQTGYSVNDLDDHRQYVEHIVELLEDDAKRNRMASAARDHIVHYHSYGSRVDAWKRIG
jgi:glycosyltransferase involved in cell wall biosynthesis